MRALLISLIVGSFHLVLFAQQFQLEATIDKYIEAIIDIDGDGIMEYIADSNKVYDGLTHNLKYTIPAEYNFNWGDAIEANNPYAVFPHIDFNSDGKRDLICTSYYSFPNPDVKLIVFDIVNNILLFEFDPPEGEVELLNCIDIDGDGELELVIETKTGIYPNTIYKTYIYSTGVTTSALDETYFTPTTGYQLKQNFPNPFNPSTTIRYSLSVPEKVSIKIYDVSAQLVKEINKEHNQAGEFEVNWEGKNEVDQKVSSGVYFYQLSVGNYNEAKKMILLK